MPPKEVLLISSLILLKSPKPNEDQLELFGTLRY
jgi:hypothetical protein